MGVQCGRPAPDRIALSSAVAVPSPRNERAFRASVWQRSRPTFHLEEEDDLDRQNKTEVGEHAGKAVHGDDETVNSECQALHRTVAAYWYGELAPDQKYR